MKDPTRMAGRNMARTRNPYLRGAITALALLSLGCVGGCPDEFKAKEDEFRSVAADSLSSGFKSIATGFIDGVFAVIEPDDATTTTSSTE